ncbi:unnamed protein product [Haemonchus placei]|uniref:Ran gtpase-activating protein n=1 Tax=Haemonchus placei TaxID=6290 RepID=A0A0N4W801_HAEPC|nr:unnamed protein product [Haemonchus placei]
MSLQDCFYLIYKMLSLLDKQIKMDSADDAESVAKQIEECPTLRTLELRGNTVGVEAGRRLAQALEMHPELEAKMPVERHVHRKRSMCSAMINAHCHITELDLSDNAFGPIGAEGISQFLVSKSAYSLQVLKLNNNGLGAGGKTIAECLLKCHRNASADGHEFKLKTFVAGRNRLEDPGAKALAEAFTVLGSLEEVSIPQNGIRAAGICALARSFRSNPSLRLININDNTCTVEGALALAEVLDELTEIEVLDLGDSLCRDDGILSISEALSEHHYKLQLCKIPAEPIARQIEQHPCMRVLDLRGNTLGIESGTRIAEAIKRHPELQRCLWSDLFTGRLKNEIPPILRSLCSAMIATNCHITELDLSDNAFGPIGAEGIQEFLVSPAAFSLEVLKLNNNGLGAGGKVIAKCLSECFVRSFQAKRRLKLKTFIAGRNRLEVPGAVALAEAFTPFKEILHILSSRNLITYFSMEKIGSLEEFAVPQNGITAKGVEALAACFEGNPNLRVINLNDNTATQLGSAAIAKALPSLPRLEVLNLGDCLCRDQGCHAIVDALSPTVHKALKEVDLSGAEMSGAAAMQIVEKWKKFPSTVRLIVSSNNFGGVFEQLRAVVNQNIVLGESDDDQGSLSSDDEEKMSAEETSDDDGLKMEAAGAPSDPDSLLKRCRSCMEAAQDRFESATQEKAAKLILELADIIAKSSNNESIIEMAVDIAEDVIKRVEAVRRRPIHTTSQLVNHLIAQSGFVKCEEKWGIAVNRTALARLLSQIIARGHLSDCSALVQNYL